MRAYCGWPLIRFASSVCLIGSARVAAADPLAQVNLRWEAPEPCPDVVALKAQLSRDLQGSQSREPLDVDARVERVGESSWSVQIRTSNAAGQSDRSLTARSCQALSDATSLIVAMQLDPETAATHARAIEGLSEPAIAPRPSSVSEPQVAYPAQLLPPPPAITRRPLAVSGTTTHQKNQQPILPPNPRAGPARWHGLLSAWVSRDWGTLPSASAMFGGALGLRRDSWWIEAGLGTSLREDLSQRGGPVVGNLAVATAPLRLCHRTWEQSRFSLSPCAGLEWARWSSQGSQNLASQRIESATTLSAGARLMGMLRISEHLNLLVPLDVVLPLNRPRFGVIQAAERQVEVFTPSWIAARVGTGLQLAFP